MMGLTLGVDSCRYFQLGYRAEVYWKIPDHGTQLIGVSLKTWRLKYLVSCLAHHAYVANDIRDKAGLAREIPYSLTHSRYL